MVGKDVERAVNPEETGWKLRIGGLRAGSRRIPAAKGHAGDARPAGVRHGRPRRQDDDVGAGYQAGAGRFHGRLHKPDRADVPDAEVLA